jgi:hypothetical protein
MTTLRWLVCDLVSGDMLDELPLTVSGGITVRVAREDSTTFLLPVADDACPAGWAESVVDGKSMIVLTIDDQPAQGWYVEETKVGSSVVEITAKTLETCLDRTNVPDHEPALTEDLSTSAAIVAGELPARWGFTIQATPSGVNVGDRTWSYEEDRSVLTALNEDIMGADGGPEWRIVLRAVDATNRSFLKVLEIKPRVGQDRPDAVFDLDQYGDGSIASYTRVSSFAKGKGATMLIGTSEGSGESRPMTDPIVSDLIDQGWPIVEERVNFTGLGQGDEDEDTELDRRTVATIIQRQHGAQTWTITARDIGPQPGVDYELGDTVRVDVAPQSYETTTSIGALRTVVIDPDGGTSSPRILGWTLDVETLETQPVLWDDDADG